MMGTRDTLSELGQAVANYVNDKKNGKPDDRKFPRGALRREISEDRAGIPWSVKERLSWMVELIRSVSLGTSVWPRVATEMVCRPRSMVTASSEGFSASASATERARHFAAALSFATSDSKLAGITG